MKTLKQTQEENRKFIIMANNPTAKSYDEALEMELGFGCEFKIGDGSLKSPFLFFRVVKNYKKYVSGSFNKSTHLHHYDKKDIKVIGKPLTLSRVLISICEVYSKIEHSDNIDSIYIYDIYGQKKIKWDLTKESLEEQSEETQIKINELIK